MNKLFFLCAALAFVACASAQTKTACQLAKEKEDANKTPTKIDVKCTASGQYEPLQCEPATKNCHCVLPDGTKVTSPSLTRRFCACDIARAAARKLSGTSTPTWIPTCTRDGLYNQKQCESPVGGPGGRQGASPLCWCVDPQTGTQTSKGKKAGIHCA